MVRTTNTKPLAPARAEKAFRIKVRVYNNRLVRAREEMGLSQTEAARQMGVSNGILCDFETLRRRAWSEVDGWIPSALRVAEFYGYSPEYLWPEEIEAVRKNAFALELAAEDVAQLLSPDEHMSRKELGVFMGQAHGLLTQRERSVLQATLVEERTLADTGTDYSLSQERIRQIRDKALRKLRLHIDRSKVDL